MTILIMIMLLESGVIGHLPVLVSTLHIFMRIYLYTYTELTPCSHCQFVYIITELILKIYSFYYYYIYHAAEETSCPTLTESAILYISYDDVNETEMNERPVGTVANFSCETGYTLNGTVNSTCGVNGGWYPAPPSCDSE